MMNNKQFGESVKWNEEYKFLKNIPQLYWSADRKDIYVGFQVKEKDKPKNMQDPVELQNYNGTFNMVGWNFVKVNKTISWNCNCLRQNISFFFIR